MSQDDEQWIARLRSTGAEQQAAISQLREILLRGIAAAIHNRYDARVQPDDVVQEALMRILDKLDSFKGKSKFTTWAMTIAVRIAISELRRRHFKDVSMSSLVEDSMSFQSESVLPSDDEKDQVLAKLRELIDSELTPKQRDAVHALLNGVPVEVFAEQIGSNRNAVYKLTHDARIRLRRGLEAAGFEAIDSIMS